MGCVNGRWVWREKSGMGREEEEERKKRKKKNEKKKKKRKELVWQGKDKTQTWAHNMNIFTKMSL